MATKAKIDGDLAKKRRWRRYHFDALLGVTIKKPTHATVRGARGSAMNEGGIALHADRELSIGTQLEIEFTFPHFDRPLRLRGVIRNRAGNCYGVEFLVGSAAEQEQLAIFRQILRSKVGCLDA